MQKSKIKILIIIFLFVFFNMQKVLADDTLLQSNDFVYSGAFRVPSGGSGYATLGAGGYAIAYNSIGNSNAMCTGNASPYSCCSGSNSGTCAGGGSLFMVANNAAANPGGYITEINVPQSVCLDGSGNATSCSNYVMPSAPTNVFTNLKTASQIQGFVEDTYGLQNTISSPAYTGSMQNNGFLVYNGKLIGSTKAYYDGSSQQMYSHFTNNLNLSINNFSGYYKLNTGLFAGYSAGPMSTIPLTYQSQLGGKILTGQSFGPIATTDSYGPCAITFDPDNLVSANLPPNTIPATALIYYNSAHSLTGGFYNNNQTGNMYSSPADAIGGTVFPENTRSVLFFGKHGQSTTDGRACYGAGTSSLAAAYSDGCPGGAGTCQFANRLVAFSGSVTSGTFIIGETIMQTGTNAKGNLVRIDGTYGLEFLGSGAPSGANSSGTWTGQTSGAIFTPNSNFVSDTICYDPTNSSKGTHAYPYVNYVWAYDVGDASGNNTSGNSVSSLSSTNANKNNLTAVKLGFIQPYEVVPYATWVLNLPTMKTISSPGNISGAAWDPVSGEIFITQTHEDGGSSLPLIHEFKLANTLNLMYKNTDFVNMVSNWLHVGSGNVSDFNSDNVVNAKDLGIMMSKWN